jgi:endonuclease YncB( thermonuclease family)
MAAHRSVAVLLPIALGLSCGTPAAPTPPSSAPPAVVTHTIQSVTDGDTVRLAAPFMGTTSVRLLNIDAPELGGASQEPWARASRDSLLALLPAGATVQVLTDRTTIDSFGRVLGIIVRNDGLDVNREQLRFGHAVTYFIWPNAERFADYRLAQIEAQNADRGIWMVSAPLGELPFEFRLRADNDRPFRPVGDVLTRMFVEAADYRQVHVNNRMFFASRTEATSAAYTACPRSNAVYDTSCFAPGR